MNNVKQGDNIECKEHFEKLLEVFNNSDYAKKKGIKHRIGYLRGYMYFFQGEENTNGIIPGTWLVNHLSNAGNYNHGKLAVSNMFEHLAKKQGKLVGQVIIKGRKAMYFTEDELAPLMDYFVHSIKPQQRKIEA